MRPDAAQPGESAVLEALEAAPEEALGRGRGRGVRGAPERALRAFSPEERERLVRLRRHVLEGQRSDAFPVDRRQDFIRWLIARGRLSDR